MPAAPEIVDGMRQPRSVRLEDIRRGTDVATALPMLALASEGVTVYISPTRRYRVQITAPSAYIDPATGRKNTGGKMIVAEFEDGVYRNGAPGSPAYRKPEIKALIDEAMKANPYFGRFVDGKLVAEKEAQFWLASEQREVGESKRIKQAIDTLKSVPREQLEARLAELRQGDADDHDMTTVPNAAAEPAGRRPTIKPIAA